MNNEIKCPFCSGDMELGKLFGNTRLGQYWLPEDISFGTCLKKLCLTFDPEKHAVDLGGIILQGYEPFYEFNNLCKAYLCRSCKKVIIDYSNIPQK